MPRYENRVNRILCIDCDKNLTNSASGVCRNCKRELKALSNPSPAKIVPSIIPAQDYISETRWPPEEWTPSLKTSEPEKSSIATRLLKKLGMGRKRSAQEP